MSRPIMRLSVFLLLFAASSAPSQTETRADPPSKAAVDLHGDALPPGAVARFGTLRLRHQSEVEQMAISPDGSLLASCGAGAHLWDLKTGQEVERFQGKLEAERMAFSADGKTLLTGSGAGVLQHWDVSSGKMLEKFTNPKAWPPVAEKEKVRLESDDRWLASSPDRRTMAVYRDGVVTLNDAGSGKLIHSLKDGSRGRGFIPIVEFSADGRLIVVANQDYSIRVWETATGKQLHSLPGHRGSLECLAFSPDGKSLASGSSFDGTVIVWDVATSRARHIWDDHYLAVWAVAWSPDGSLLASGDGCNGTDHRESLIRLFDPRAGKQLRQITAHLNNVHSLAFSPDGKRLASVGWDARARVWDPLTGTRLQQLRSSDHLQTVSFSSDGKTLLLSAHLGEVEAYRTDDWELIHHRKPIQQGDGSTWHIAFLQDGKTVVTREQKGNQGRREASAEICFRSVEDDRLLRSVTITGVLPYYSFDCVALSPMGDLYAESVADKNGKGVRVWETATGKLLGSYYGHTEKINALAFSQDGRWLATGSRDTTILLWDLADNRLQFLWSALVANPEDALGALKRLEKAPANAFPWLAVRLRSIAELEVKAAPSIAQLNDDNPEKREKASLDLAALGIAVRPVLEMALEEKPSAETRLRIQSLLKTFSLRTAGEPAFGGIQARTAVRLLERIGNTEARKVLDELAKAPPSSRLAQDAQAALRRWETHKSADKE